MKGSVVKVLLIEDDEDDVLLTREYLSESQHYVFEVSWESDIQMAYEKMLHGDFDVFLIDYRLGIETGIDIIRFVQSKGLLKPCILLTGQGDFNVDMDASKSGAADYLIKTDLNPSLLERSIRYSITQFRIVRALDEKEKRYRSLFEHSVDPIFLATSDLKLPDVNEAFLNFFGYEHNQPRIAVIQDLFSEKSDYEYFRSTLIEEGQVRDFEVELLNKKGSKKYCVINCVYIPDQASDFCCYQGIIHDLTMRKKVEKDMLIAERLSMTGKIARTIAHEVRNPLTNLNLALGQLKEEMPEDNESVNLFCDIMQRNVNRIEQLISEMLNSSKPKDFLLELIPLTTLIEETLSLASDRIKLKGIKLIKHLVEEIPRILVDKEKMKIALLNIIVNAIEAMTPLEGVLSISTTCKENIATIAITDNGKGIAPNEIDKLFDPFFTGKPGGMGLGLTSTKNIVDSHNSEIEVISEVNKGTTFFLHFKLAQ